MKTRGFISRAAARKVRWVNDFFFSTERQLLGRVVSRIETRQRVLALTFDDGPSEAITAPLLDLFAGHAIKATFFVVGRQAERYPSLVRRMVTEGHEVGNHSYSHPEMLLLRPSLIAAEIDRTDAILRSLGVREPIQFRVPYGKKFFSLPYVLARKNRPNIMWDHDTRDFKGEVTADDIVNGVLHHTRPGSIVLFHDCFLKTLAANKQLIPALKQQGYSFRTVSQLLEMESSA